jgi:Rrf2 family protein
VIRLNRTTEYGLMALRYISRKQGCTSAREVADTYGLPFEITAKTLLRLKDLGLIQSTQGARGGYTLQRSMKDISLAQFLEMMEGPQFLVTCTAEMREDSERIRDCEYRPRCEIQHVLGDLNSRILRFFSSISLAELTDSAKPASPGLGAAMSQVAISAAAMGWEEP